MRRLDLYASRASQRVGRGQNALEAERRLEHHAASHPILSSAILARVAGAAVAHYPWRSQLADFRSEADPNLSLENQAGKDKYGPTHARARVKAPNRREHAHHLLAREVKVIGPPTQFVHGLRFSTPHALPRAREDLSRRQLFRDGHCEMDRRDRRNRPLASLEWSERRCLERGTLGGPSPPRSIPVLESRALRFVMVVKAAGSELPGWNPRQLDWASGIGGYNTAWCRNILARSPSRGQPSAQIWKATVR